MPLPLESIIMKLEMLHDLLPENSRYFEEATNQLKLELLIMGDDKTMLSTWSRGIPLFYASGESIDRRIIFEILTAANYVYKKVWVPR